MPGDIVYVDTRKLPPLPSQRVPSDYHPLQLVESGRDVEDRDPMISLLLSGDEVTGTWESQIRALSRARR